MFGTQWRLFRVFGITISVSASWLIILVLLTLSFASGFPDILHYYFPGARVLPHYEFWIMGFVTAIAFFACVLLHELGHALVARSRGMKIRGITLFLFGGVAELGEEPPSAATEFLMAVAGPAVSLVLAIFCAIVAVSGFHRWRPEVVIVFGYLGAINAMVLIFNLIPAFPLDGGRVLRSILWGASGNLRSATFWASLLGRGFAWMLIAYGVYLFFAGNWVGGIWMGLIGVFLNNAARTSYQQMLVREALRGETVGQFMNPNPIAVPADIDLHSWVEDYVYRFHHRAFPVITNGQLEGIITTQALDQVPRGDWRAHTVGEFMTDPRPVTITPSADAVEALGRMQKLGASRLLVVDAGRLVGIVSVKDLLHFLDLKLHSNAGGDRNDPELYGAYANRN